MNTFIIDEAFIAYLKLGGLDIKQLSKIQLQETKRAFYAGCGYMLRTLEKTVNIPDEEAMDHIAKLEWQIENFLHSENIEHQKRNN